MITGEKKIITALAMFLIIWTNAACLRTSVETNQSGTAASPSAKDPENPPRIAKTTTPSEKLMPMGRSKNSEGDLSCSPDTLKSGDILTLKMKTPHGGYLEIVTPIKKYIFLSEADGDKLVDDARKSGAKPFYQASEFAKLSELSLDTQNAATIDYEKNATVQGKYATVKIFSAVGKYKILLSEDSFETDDPTITGKCEVSFTN